jgi:hypothetical protein
MHSTYVNILLAKEKRDESTLLSLFVTFAFKHCERDAPSSVCHNHSHHRPTQEKSTSRRHRPDAVKTPLQHITHLCHLNVAARDLCVDRFCLPF